MSVENRETENTTEEQIVQDKLLGPGERLRAARLASDIDLKKIASQLRLTTDVVEALERDDYSGMNARVFVRGYIRNYARFVQLPVDSIMQQFDQRWPDDERPVKLSRPPRLPSDSRLGKRWKGIINWLLLLLVIALFLVWWQGYLDEFMDQHLSKSSSSTPEQTVQEIQPGELLPLPQLEQSAPVVEQPIIVAPIESIVEEPIVETAEVSERIPTLVEPEPVVVEVAAESTPQVAEDENTQQVTEATAPEIYISFTKTCWVDIRDSKRRFKILGQMQSGDKHKLEGVPPYDVVLGNASAASIMIDGEAFDIDQYTNGNVARFTLTL